MTKTTAILVFFGATTALIANEASRADTSEPSAGTRELEEIVVTATKKEHAENVQDVPIAMTAYDSKQLEAHNYQNLTSLAYTMPNVALDANGTTNATANFSIRGLSINSSIPSVQPRLECLSTAFTWASAAASCSTTSIWTVSKSCADLRVCCSDATSPPARWSLNTKAPSDTFSATAHVGGRAGPELLRRRVDHWPADSPACSTPSLRSIATTTRLVQESVRRLADSVRTTRRSRARLTLDAFRCARSHPSLRARTFDTGDGHGGAESCPVFARFVRLLQRGHRPQGQPLGSGLLEANWKVGLATARITNIAGWRTVSDAWQDGDIDANLAPGWSEPMGGPCRRLQRNS